MQSEYRIAIVIDANGEALIAELDETTGEIRKTHKAAELLGKSTEEAGEKSKKGGRGLREFGDRSKSLQKNIAGAIGILGKMAGLITGALGVSLSVGVINTINFGDQVHKLHQRLGASTEALSEYSHVANKTGVEFNQLTTAWQRQSRRVAEAAKGYGEAQGALQELGLDAKKLKELKPEEQFEVIADRMAEVTDESDRVRLAMRLWDTEGVALLQTIEGGSAALREMRQEARDLGKTISEKDALNMVAAKDATANLQAAIDGLKIQLAVNFAPTLANIAGFIGDVLVPEFLDFLDTIGLLNQEIDKLNSKGLDVKLGNLQEITKGYDRQELLESQAVLKSIMEGGKDFDHGTAVALKHVNEKLAAFDEIDRVKALLAELEQAAQGSAASLHAVGEGVDAASQATGDLANNATALNQALAGESNAVQQFVASLSEQVNTLGMSEEATLQLTAEQVKAQLQNEKLAPTIDALVSRYLASSKAAAEQEKMEAQLAKARGTQLTLLDELKSRYDPVNAALDEWNRIEEEMLLLLNDENTDQEQLALTLEYVTRAREAAAHAAELQLNPAQALIEQLQLEDQALRLAIATNEDLELAKLRLQGATDEEIQQIIKLREEQALLNLEYNKGGVAIDTLADAVENSVKRMDDVTYDFVRSAISSWDSWRDAGKNAIDAVKSLFLDTIAAMIHAAITQPIVVQLTTALSGITAGAVSAAGGGTAAGGAGLLGTLANGGNALLGLFTSGIGKYITAGGYWLDKLFGMAPGTGVFGQLTTPFANPFAFKAGLAGHLGGLGAVGPAALIGALLGGVLGYDPVMTGAGAGIGAGVGTLILPGVGTAIGGILGGLAGAFFGSREREPILEVSTVSKANASSSDYDQFFGSDLGGLNLRSRRIGSEEIAQLGQDLASFDNALALLAQDDDHLQAMTDALANFELLLEGKAISIDTILNQRFSAVLGTFNDDVQGYVNAATELQEKVERLEVASLTTQLMDEFEELFGSRTFADVMAAAELVQGAGESINDALLRLVGDMQVAAVAIDALQQLGSADPFALYQQQKDAENQTAYGALGPLGDSLRAAMTEFDGTTASLVRVAEAASNLKLVQIELAGQYDALADQIAGFGLSIEDRLNRIVLGDEGYKQLVQGQLDDERERLMTLTDPTQIASSLVVLEGLIASLVNLTSEDDLLSQGQFFIDLLAQIRTDAEAQRQAGIAELEASSATTGEELDAFVLTLGDPLEIAAGRHIEAAQGLSESAVEITSAAAFWEEVGAGVGRDIAAGISEGARAAAGIAASTANEVRGSLSGISNAIAYAVRDSLSGMTLQVPAAARGSATND